MFIFREGIPIAVPAAYDRLPEHVALVTFLTEASSYRAVVAFLELHTISWLAADVLRGVPWACRFLNSTAQLSLGSTADRALAQRGCRAMLRVLSGARTKTGRKRKVGLTPTELATGAAAIAKWRAVVEAAWTADARGDALIAAGPWSAAHRRALRRMLRGPRPRRAEVVLALASWETGIAVRRLRSARPVADMVYG